MWSSSLVELSGWAVLVIGALELLNWLALEVPPRLFFAGKHPLQPIPVRGKPLEHFELLDYIFIWFNKGVTVLFTMQTLDFCLANAGKRVLWELGQLGLLNSVGVLVAFFVVYDFFYNLFHRGLHHPSIYGLVHKHHHRQMAPSRANYDAINVHPFEMVVGEYLHIVSIVLVSFVVPVHMAAVLGFLVIGGLLASLNHTRYPLHCDPLLFDVRYHDQHHVQPRCNYSQYTVLWDKVFGTFQLHPSMRNKGVKLEA
jgi:sterol desaturase/sphingolipid hydroxylase (fatty acid hydroxylase superfamily)